MAEIKRASSGFTLIEISIALFILSAALVVLLSLQSSVLRRTVDDRMVQQAMLASREILTWVELGEDNLTVEQRDESADQLISYLAGPDAVKDSNLEELKSFRARWSVEYWGIPNSPKALKRALLNLSWGDSPRESVTTVYFVPSESEEATDEDG